MSTLIIIVAVGLSIELIYRPRIDYTSNNDYLLWYNKNGKRHCVKL